MQALVALYVAEVHNRFSRRAYRIATETVPIALTRLLTASRPSDLVLGDFDPESRILVRGPLATLRSLSANHTLILAPTHLSNLDSPLIGYALYKAGLDPFIYGAGLNLFSNPVMALFMSRLGAYTVDRRKRHRLYKDVLKDYVSSFGPRFTGLTGTQEAVDAAVRNFKAYYRKVPLDGGDYTIDHTAVVYLFDGKGNFVGPFNYKRPAEESAAELRKLL